MKVTPVCPSPSSVSFNLSKISVNMNRFWATLLVLIIVITVTSARPTHTTRQKRQSDQRLAELETLLALQKYNGHRVRGWTHHNDLLSPGFGLIDFDKIGRRKKSTRFSPGGEQGQDSIIWNTLISKSSNHLKNLPRFESQMELEQK